ncbi:ADP-ribosylglycohydrolase [Micromonospora sp. Llam0]|nr:ADP-ribosylglycohydrolase [Micromonospora sp. Llam0]
MAACADALGGGAQAATPRRGEVYRPPMRFGIATVRLLALTRHLAERQGAVDEQVLSAEMSAVPELATPSSRVDRIAPSGAPPSWIAPIGLIPGLGLTAVADSARRAARAAIDNDEVVAAAVVQAVGVALAARSSAVGRLRPVEFVRVLQMHARHPTCAQGLGAAAEAAEAANDGLVDNLTRQFADGDPVLSVTGVAVAAFLAHHDNPIAAIAAALLAQGSNSDAGMMTAAMCGARLGDQRTPPRWATRLQSSWLVWTASNHLAALGRPVGRRQSDR